MKKKQFVKLNPSSIKELLKSKDTHNMAIVYAWIVAEAYIDGQAYMGNYDAMGLPRQQYRTALEKLEKQGYIKLYRPNPQGKVASNIAVLLK